MPLSYNSLRTYAGKAAKDRAAGRRAMPRPVRTEKGVRLWRAGELALWMAIKSPQDGGDYDRWPDNGDLPGQVKAVMAALGPDVTQRDVARELGRDPDSRLIARLYRDAGGQPQDHADVSPDKDVAAFLKDVLKDHGPGIDLAATAEKAREAGLSVGEKRLGQALTVARAEAIQAAMRPATAELAALETLRADGLVTATQVAKAFGVSAGAVSHAKARGELTPVGSHVVAGRRRDLYDPAKITVRRSGRAGPCDVGSAVAADITLKRD
jgi:hypothetical protein